MIDEPLNKLEADILRALDDRRGRNNAIGRAELVRKINDMCPLFPVSERTIRKTIKHLVERHGEWIGSCRDGYFIIQTQEELTNACKYYHGYALSLLHVEARLRKVSLPALIGQLQIEFKT